MPQPEPECLGCLLHTLPQRSVESGPASPCTHTQTHTHTVTGQQPALHTKPRCFRAQHHKHAQCPEEAQLLASKEETLQSENIVSEYERLVKC